MKASDGVPGRAPRTGPGYQLLKPAEWQALGAVLRLSPRELQVVQGVFDEQKEAALARQIGVSAPTVHTYLRRLYRKLGVASRVGLVIRVIATQLEHGAPETRLTAEGPSSRSFRPTPRRGT